MVTILGTTFGNRLGNSFWLFFCCTSLRRWACRRPRFPFLCRPEKTNNASWRANTNTTARVSDGLARSVVRLGAPRCGYKFWGFAIETFFQSGCHCLCTRARCEHALAIKNCAAICETSRRGFTPERTSRDGPRRADSHKTPARAYRKACATSCIFGF